MNVDGVIKSMLAIGGFLAIRAIARFKVESRNRRTFVTPLIDPVVLETAFVTGPGEDANLVAEVRDTIKHLNRQAYADEFYTLDNQIASLEPQLPGNAKVTLRHLLQRLLTTDDRWLQLVAAKTCGRLNITEALPRLEALIAESEDGPVGQRLRGEIVAVVSSLRNGPTAEKMGAVRGVEPGIKRL